MRLLDLFSGIGGFSLASEWCWGDELEIEAFVEIDPFCQKVLKKHWPEVPIYDDIKKIQWVVADSDGIYKERPRQELEGEYSLVETNEGESEYKCVVRIPRQIDLLTGGFPCQPFSCAGKRAGTEDDRHLWPEMLRAIHEIKPRWVLAENVPGLLTLQDGVVFEGVCADLEDEGYEVLPFVIPACSQGAPHRRDRVWIVAHNAKLSGHRKHSSFKTEQDRDRKEDGLPESADCHAPDTECTKRRKNFQQGQLSGRWEQDAGRFGSSHWSENWYEVATRFCRVDDGVPNRVDRLKSLGNAVVPQVAYQIFMAIKQMEIKCHGSDT